MIHDQKFTTSLAELIAKLFAEERTKIDRRFGEVAKGIDVLQGEIVSLHRRETFDPNVLAQMQHHIDKDVHALQGTLETLHRELDGLAERTAQIVIDQVSADLRALNLDYNERALKLFNDAEVKVRGLKDGEPGRDGADGAPGLNGVDGQDGFSPDPEIIAELTAEKVMTAVRTVLDRKIEEFDTKSGNLLTTANERMTSLRDGIDGIDGKDGLDGKDGIDGKDGVDGKDGLDGANGLNGIDGIDGKDGVDGVSPDAEVLVEQMIKVVGPAVDEKLIAFQTDAALLLDSVSERIASVRDGVDGKDGVDGTSPDPEMVAEQVLAFVGRTVDEKLTEFTDEAKRIFSETEVHVAALHDGRDGIDGKDGRDGIDGKDGQGVGEGELLKIVASATERVRGLIEEDVHVLLSSFVTPPSPAEITALIDAAVEKAVPSNYAKVTEKTMQSLHHLELRLAEARGGEKGDAGAPGRDGRDGERGEQGPPGIGIQGAQGLPGEPGEQGPPGSPGLDGVDGREWDHKGTYDPKELYQRSDVVALDGGSFVAVRDLPGDCPGPGWRLLSGRGRSGQRGEQGPRGMKGDKGETGVGITDVVEKDGKVYFLLSDGRTVVIPWTKRT